MSNEKNIMYIGSNAAQIEENTGISQRVQEEICLMAKKYHIQKIVLFGSRARGDYRRISDIDLAVYGGEYAEFCLDVDETTYTLLKYDFVYMDSNVQPELREAIEKEGITLYEKI